MLSETIMVDHGFYDYCIVGAGPAGLTLASQLLKNNKRVVIIERNDIPGGLCRSYHFDGHTFDMGPKRFFVSEHEVLQFITEISGGEFIRIGRSTEVFFRGRFFRWPLSPLELFRLPPAILPHCFLDLVRKRATGTSHSFHQYISSRYGRTLYREFFLPYTKKFLRWDPEDLHEDWGNAGINRSVIDGRIKTGNLNDIIRLLVFPRRVRTEFLYPSSGGFGGFFEKLYHRCQLHRELFRAIFSEVISSLSYRDNRFTATTSGGKSLRFGKLIWSGNINDLLPLVSAERSFLPFLNTVFFYLICRSDAVRSHNAQWIYVSRGDTLISRITCMKEFAEYTCQKGYYNLVCEVTDSQLKQRYFEKPRLYTDVLLKELRGLGLLKNSKGVDAVEIRPVVDTYPIYHRHYVEEFRRALGDIHSFSEKIYLLGRCGSFWYNNTDHSIKMALELSRILLGNATGFSSREFPGGSYQEYIRFFEGKKNVL